MRTLICIDSKNWNMFYIDTDYVQIESHTCSNCGTKAVAIQGFETKGGEVCTCNENLPTNYTWFAADMFKPKPNEKG